MGVVKKGNTKNKLDNKGDVGIMVGCSEKHPVGTYRMHMTNTGRI